MRAYNLQQVDHEYHMHLQAWLNYQVQATKEQGKNKHVPVFQSFKQFYDYEKEIKKVDKPKTKTLTDRQRRTARLIARINSLT